MRELNKTAQKNDDTAANWHQVYTSLFLILVVFFVALLAHSTPVEEKLSELRHATFGIGNTDEIPFLNAVRFPEYQTLREKTMGYGIIGLDKTEKGLRIRIDTARLFPKCSSELLPEGRSFLDALAKEVSRERRRMVIESEVECRFSEDMYASSSWRLAVDRAYAVWRHLRETCGLESHVARAVAVGRSCLRQSEILSKDNRESNFIFHIIR